MALPQAREPFQFCTRLSLQEATGLAARTIPQLLKYLRAVPGSVIYHHTHRFLQEHQYLTPEPPNDFAYWVTEVLGEKALGEQLNSIDTVQLSSIRALRERLAQTLELYLKAHPPTGLRRARPEEAFHFIRTISVIFPTPYRVSDLNGFAQALEAVSINSLYYHIFESRLRLERGKNDFSFWLEEACAEARLARAVASLDPYSHTMEELRQTILRLVRQRAAELEGRCPSPSTPTNRS
ncbi:MAG: hypothetical protein HYZ93_03570 [Candidatus Omnitrophica bacterium]|nr:hypothetical protein [Candidatus Omnitrophota bacterium]